MSRSFTDALQQDRVTVVGVDPARRQLRVRGPADACADLSCSAQTLVVSDQGTSTDLGTLNPGDIVRLENGAGDHPQRIVVVRRVWDEFSSPEW